MIITGRPGHAEGVGVMYHPFLHDYLLARAELFDFIELPLDLYIDPARSSLLDPGQVRLRQVIAAKPCSWRGSALSLGSIRLGSEVSFAAYTLRTVRGLLDMAPDARYTEAIGFRTAEHGSVHAMPFTPAAAHWIARRQAEAQDALGIPIYLHLPAPTHPAAATDLDGIAFFALIREYGGGGFIVDAANVAAALPAWPNDVAALSVSSDDAAAWVRLSAMAEYLKPRTIILCRNRQLFPLDTIEQDLRRARSLIAEPMHERVPGLTAPRLNPPDAEDLAALHAYQCSVSDPCNSTQPCPSAPGAAGSWQNWRNQVDDMHKAQQIAAFLSRRSDPGASWRAS